MTRTTRIDEGRLIRFTLAQALTLMAAFQESEERRRADLTGTITPWDFANEIHAVNRHEALQNRGIGVILGAMHLGWGITQRCNCNCLHCWSTGVGRGIEPGVQYLQVIADRIVASDLLTVTFSGGEPLLRKDLFDIIGRLRRRPVGIEILSNGHFLKNRIDEIAEHLSRPGDLIQVSMDAPDAKGYKEIRKYDGFESSLEGIEAVRAQDILVRVHCVVTVHNVAVLPEILRLAARVGASEFSVVPVAPVGRGVHESAKLDIHAYYEALYNTITTAQADKIAIPITFKVGWSLYSKLRKNGVQWHNDEADQLVYCGDSLQHACINLDGSLHPSSRPELLSLGNLLNRSVAELWPAPKAQPVIRDLRDTLCGDCPGLKFCGGGDPIAAYHRWGTINAPDPRCPILVQAAKHLELTPCNLTARPY